jgi:hypothetical protein
MTPEGKLHLADLFADLNDPDPFLLDDDDDWDDDPEADPPDFWWARKLDDGADIQDQS